jgi:hypothetical protein
MMDSICEIIRLAPILTKNVAAIEKYATENNLLTSSLNDAQNTLMTSQANEDLENARSGAVGACGQLKELLSSPKELLMINVGYPLCMVVV